MRQLHHLLLIAIFSIISPSNASVHPIAAEPFLNVNKQPTFAAAISLPIANQSVNYKNNNGLRHADIASNTNLTPHILPYKKLRQDSVADNPRNKLITALSKSELNSLEHLTNDNFSAAIELQNQPARITSTTVNATPEAGEPCHRMFNCDTGSVWYRYTAQRTGTLRLEASAPQVTPHFQAYTGTVLSNLTPLSEPVNYYNKVVWQAEIEAGTTVHIAVAQNVDQTSEFNLIWRFSAANSTAIADVPLLDNTLKQCVLDTGVSYAEEITRLDCYGVAYPTGIEYFVNLEILSLTGQNYGPNYIRVLRDLTPITRLTNLNYLFLKENQLSDSTLMSLSLLKLNSFDNSGLVNLDLSQNRLTKDAIPTLVQILTTAQRVSLTLEYNEFTHVEGLDQILGLHYLLIGKNPITNVQTTVNSLSNLTELTYLNLSGLNLRNLDNINLPANLTSLSLSENPISDLTAIVDNISSTAITQLSLAYTNISDASALSRLNLSSLQLDYSDVSDLSFLANMNTLRYLGIDHTNVSSLKPLLNLPNLDIVSMEGNPQFNCNEMINFQNSRPDVLLVNNQLDGFCRFHSGNSFRLTKVRGNYDVSHVEFSAWDGIDYSQYGSISWENGVLTFIPHPGVTAPVTLKIAVTTVEGIYLNIACDLTLNRLYNQNAAACRNGYI